MTSKQRTQYMALSIVEGFGYELRKIKDALPPKTMKAIDRIMHRVACMKDDLGQATVTDGTRILAKHDAVKAVIDKYGVDNLMVGHYIQAVQVVVADMCVSVPNIDLRSEWATLEGMLFTVFSHLEEIGEADYSQESTEFGVNLLLACRG